MTKDFKVLMGTTFSSPFAVIAGVLTGQAVVSSSKGEVIDLSLVLVILSCWFASALIVGVAILSVLNYRDRIRHD